MTESPFYPAIVFVRSCRATIDAFYMAIRAIGQVYEPEVQLRHERTLCAQGVVALWSEIEALIYDTLVIWLQYTPDAWLSKDLEGVTLSVAEFMVMTPEERCRSAIRQLDERSRDRRKDRNKQRPGIGRFELLLGAFGLGGKVDPGVRKTLFELWKVRNALVHHRGTADAELVGVAPEFGAGIVLDYIHFDRYVMATMQYGKCVADRITKKLGLPPLDDLAGESPPAP